MPTKTTKTAKPYSINGKNFIWQPLDDDDVRGNLPAITIPMRIKLKVIRKLVGQDMDVDVMFEILEAVIPNQAEALDEMDISDFEEMFTTWQTEYKALSGASLGE